MYIKDEFIKKVYVYEIDVVTWKIMTPLYISRNIFYMDIAFLCVYLHTFSCCIDVRRAFDQPRTATDGQTGWFVNCWHLALNSLTSAADAISTTVFVFHFIHKIDFVVMNDYTRFYFHTDKKCTFKKSVSTKCWKITIKNRGK